MEESKLAQAHVILGPCLHDKTVGKTFTLGNMEVCRDCAMAAAKLADVKLRRERRPEDFR
jgi:hypothetical protein